MSQRPDPPTTRRIARRVLVEGVVQGVGFRPHVYAVAHRHHLAGQVWNAGDGVVVEVEGRAEDIDAFVAALVADAPPLARIDTVSTREAVEPSSRSLTLRVSGRAGDTRDRYAIRDSNPEPAD